MEPSALLAALSAEHAVSGAELARRLGVTRAAIWKQIEHLRGLGAPIEAAAGSGYRLAWPLEALDGDRIRTGLDVATRGRLAALAVHWRLDSTSTELQRRAATGAGAIEVVRLKGFDYLREKLYYWPINVEIDRAEEFNQIIQDYVRKN